MCLRHGVFISRIVLRAVNRAKIPLSRDATLQLVLDFAAAAMLERVGAAGKKERSSERKKNRTALHLPIVWRRPRLARRHDLYLIRSHTSGRQAVAFAAYAESFSLTNLQSEMIAPELLLQGYRLGVFPMGMPDGEIE